MTLMTQNPIQKLKERVLSKSGPSRNINVLFDMHELFIKQYGWIPLEEFRKIPMETLFNIFDSMERRLKKQKKRMPKIKKGKKGRKR